MSEFRALLVRCRARAAAENVPHIDRILWATLAAEIQQHIAASAAPDEPRGNES